VQVRQGDIHITVNNPVIRNDQGKTIKERADELVREMQRRTFSQYGEKGKWYPRGRA
jgi:hypothetical protein